MCIKFMIAVADKVGIIKLKRYLFSKINYSRNIDVSGVKVSVPSIDGIVPADHEKWMIALLHKLLTERKGAFIDVGVNIGQTLVKVKAIDSDRMYFGFEPNPTCIDYASKLVKMNGFSNCTLIPVGLFTSDGLLSLKMYCDESSDPSASLVDEFRPESKVSRTIFVPTFQFDSIASALNIDNVGIIKIDTEGAELEVIKSLTQVIERCRPAVMIEVVPDYSIDFRVKRQDALLMYFSKIDYSIFRVDKTENDDFLGLTMIDSFTNRNDPTQSDYVALPN